MYQDTDRITKGPHVRKTLLLLATAAALPLTITAAPAHAVATFNDQGVGFAARTDVQAVLGGKLPNTVTFTFATTSAYERTEQCTDGSTAVYGSSSSNTYIVTSEATTNKQGKLPSVRGWSLTGLQQTSGVANAGGGCPAANPVVGVISETSSGTRVLAVNGVVLPVTPA